MALIYVTTIAVNGLFLPYFPLWLEHAGFDAAAIAVILALPMFFRLLTTPAISAYADRSRDRAGVLIACIGATLLLSLGYFLAPTYAIVLTVSLGLAVVWPVQASLADSIALSGVRRFGADYSRMRIWGSIAYFVANFCGGVILSHAGAKVVPLLFSTMMATALAVSLFTPRLGSPRREIQSIAGGEPLLRQPFFLLFVVAAGLIQGSHAFVYSFSSIYWKSLGLSDTFVGALWAFAVIAEVMVFASFRRFLGHVTPLQTLYASGAAAALRWTLFPLVWSGGAGVIGFFAVQALHGISTGLMILGLQKMIGEAVPEHQTGGAQGISFLTANTAIAFATLGSGWLYEHFRAGGFYVMAVMAAAGFAVALVARSVQPQSAGSGGYTSEPS